MKIPCSILFTLASTCLTLPVLAGNDLGDDSARYYRQHADKYNGKKVDVDCAFVSPVTPREAVKGVAFFLAHTIDDDNGARGGAIVVAVPEKDASDLVRRFGSAIDRSGRSVHTKRLRGTLHKLDSGQIYIDASGEVHALIEAHIKQHKKLDLPEDRRGRG